MTTAPTRPHPRHGSSHDDFLEADGVRENFQAAAIKEVIAR